MEQPQLHNVTLYVDPSDFQRTRDFYVALLQGHLVWEEPGHIACVGSKELAVCVHEAEPDHPAGTRELFFHDQDLGHIAAALQGIDGQVQRPAAPGAGNEIRCVDPIGNHIRVHPREA